MAQNLKNLHVLLGLAVLALLVLTGSLAMASKGPVCTEASGPLAPGFIALPAGGTPACLRIRIG